MSRRGDDTPIGHRARLLPKRKDAPRPVGDGEGEPLGRLQDKEGLQEVGEDEGYGASTPAHGVRAARERAQAVGVLRVPWLCTISRFCTKSLRPAPKALQLGAGVILHQ
jgi:hypothetical protein